MLDMNMFAFRQLGVDILAVFQLLISWYPNFSNADFTRIYLSSYKIIILKKLVLFIITKRIWDM